MSGYQALSYARRRQLLEPGHNLQLFHHRDRARSKSANSFGPGTLVDSAPDKICFQEERPEGVIRPFRGPLRSVNRAGRYVVGELHYGIGNPAPRRRAIAIAVGRELVGARDALLERFLAVALEHQIGGAPDIDFGYHAGKLQSCGRETINTDNCMA